MMALKDAPRKLWITPVSIIIFVKIHAKSNIKDGNIHLWFIWHLKALSFPYRVTWGFHINILHPCSSAWGVSCFSGSKVSGMEKRLGKFWSAVKPVLGIALFVAQRLHTQRKWRLWWNHTQTRSVSVLSVVKIALIVWIFVGILCQ